MTYLIEDALEQINRWREARSILRVVIADVVASGSFFALVAKTPPDKPLPAGMVASVDLQVLLPNGIPSSSASIDLHFWGSEEFKFTDFTDEPVEMIPSDSMDRVSCCIAITYDNTSMVSLCEAWPDPQLEILRGPDPALMEFLERNKTK